MNLIEDLQKHVNDDNILYIYELSHIIIDEKITTLDELEQNEKDYNRVNGQEFSMDESIKRWIDLIDTYPYEFDGLSISETKKLDEERKLMNTESMNDKILHLVKYFCLTKRDNPFPYQTYKFIIEGKL